MDDAFSTAESIAKDWFDKKPFLNQEKQERREGWEAIKEIASERGLRRVSWADWKRIDKAEKANGARNGGKEREKFITTDSMLAVLD
jgi:adrenodoxin-NADP+ reductase